MALVLNGNTKVGPYTGVLVTDKAAAVDMTSEVTSFQITAAVNTIVVPATGTTPEHGRGGAADFALMIGYLSNDIALSLFAALWAAVSSASHTLFFSGSFRAGAVSATNPIWTGAFIVTEASVGGPSQNLSQASATFPMIGPPVKGIV